MNQLAFAVVFAVTLIRKKPLVTTANLRLSINLVSEAASHAISMNITRLIMAGI